MNARVERAGLSIDARLAGIVEDAVPPPIGPDAGAFWQRLAILLPRRSVDRAARAEAAGIVRHQRLRLNGHWFPFMPGPARRLSLRSIRP